MRALSQVVTATILCGLVIILGVLHAMEHLPATDYMDAMAKGQFDRARSFLAHEVAAGNPQYLTALGNLHYLGLGGEKDFEKASKLYHQAAAEGYGAAQLNLGHLYKQGLGVSKSAERAFGWYIHSKISNNPWAEYYLTQISLELTLTPLQMSVLKDRWLKLDALVAEPL